MLPITALVFLALAGSLDVVAGSRCRPSASLSSRTPGDDDSATPSRSSTPSSTPGILTPTPIPNTTPLSTPDGAVATPIVETPGSNNGEPPLSVRNLLRNGDLAAYDPNSPDRIPGYVIRGNVRVIQGRCYTLDGSQEVNCLEMTAASPQPPLAKRDLENAASASQFLEDMNTKTEYVVRLFYTITYNQQADTCRLEGSYGGQLFISTSYFPVLTEQQTAGNNLEWEKVIDGFLPTATSGDIKFALTCTNGGAAQILLDQIFLTNEVTREEIDNVSLLYDSATTISTSSSMTGTRSTATGSATTSGTPSASGTDAGSEGSLTSTPTATPGSSNSGSVGGTSLTTTPNGAAETPTASAETLSSASKPASTPSETPSATTETPSTPSTAIGTPSALTQTPSPSAGTPLTAVETPPSESQSPSTPGATPLTSNQTPVMPTETPSIPIEISVIESETPSTPQETPSAAIETPPNESQSLSTPSLTPLTINQTPSIPIETPSTPTENSSIESETPSTPSISMGTSSNEDTTPSTPSETPPVLTQTPPISAEAPSTPTMTPQIGSETPSSAGETPSPPSETPSAPTPIIPVSTETPSTPTNNPSAGIETPSSAGETPSPLSETPLAPSATPSESSDVSLTPIETPSTPSVGEEALTTSDETPSTASEIPSTPTATPSTFFTGPAAVESTPARDSTTATPSETPTTLTPLHDSSFSFSSVTSSTPSASVAPAETSLSTPGILLPLYVYPSIRWLDNAANWIPLFNAVKAHLDIPWLIVINPYNGPGESGLPGNNDPNVISGVSQLNENPNVNLIGYLPINYARASIDEVTANITNWVSWSDYEDADISINGIFFDESYADADYMHTVVTLAREAFDHPITVVCNFGVKVSVEYYALCDIVLGFESCLNCNGAPKYKSGETIEANFPAGYESQGAVVVHSFTGVDHQGKAANVDLLTSYIKDIVDYGLGWFYFTSAGYEQLTAVPATVGQNADSLASAKLASLM